MQTEQIKTGPPAPFSEREINGDSILNGDQQVVVSRKHLEAKDFDPHPGKDIVVEVQIDSVWHKVLKVEDFVSGDLAAAYRLHLRQ